MISYLGRRIIQSVLILLGISLITFALLYLLPADPVRQIAGRSATPTTVESIRRLSASTSVLVPVRPLSVNLCMATSAALHPVDRRSRC